MTVISMLCHNPTLALLTSHVMSCSGIHLTYHVVICSLSFCNGHDSNHYVLSQSNPCPIDLSCYELLRYSFKISCGDLLTQFLQWSVISMSCHNRTLALLTSHVVSYSGIVSFSDSHDHMSKNVTVK